MRLLISLLAMTAVSVGFLLLPHTFWGTEGGREPHWMVLIRTLQLFIIPLVLAMLLFSKTRIVRIFSLSYGIWMLYLTLRALLGAQFAITENGGILLSVILLFSLAIMVFSAMELSRKSKAKRSAP